MEASASRWPGTSLAPSAACDDEAMDEMRCVVVVPCYNEAARLSVASYAAFLGDQENAATRLLFVNDGSTDDTLSVLRSLQARFPTRTDILNQPLNWGKAEAVRAGMLHALQQRDCDITGFWDADLATPLAQIKDLAAILATNPQLTMVFGARVRLLGRHIHRRPLRHYLGRCFATAASTLLRLPIYDTQCGAKLFRPVPELEQALQQPFQSRWIFDVELLARFMAQANAHPLAVHRRIYEYPLPIWNDVAGSKVSPLDFFKAFWELVQIHQRYLSSSSR